MEIKSFKKFLLFFTITIAASFAVYVGNASAIDNKTLSAKAIFTGVYDCATKGAYSSDWLVSKGADNGNGFVANELDNTTVKLPYHMTDADDNNNNCWQVMMGWPIDLNGKKGEALMYGLLGVSSSSTHGNDYMREASDEEVAKFFAGDSLNGQGGLGYTAEEITGESYTQSKEIKIQVKATGGGGCDDAQLKRITNHNGVLLVTDLNDLSPSPEYQAISGNSIILSTGTKDGNNYEFTSGNGTAPSPDSSERWNYTICGKIFYVDAYVTNRYQIGDDDSLTGLNISPDGSTNGSANVDGVEITVGEPSNAQSGSNKNVEDYRMQPLNPKDSVANANTLISGLAKKNKIGYNLDITSISDLKFTDQEIYDLYTYYLTSDDVYGVEVHCGDDDSIYDQYSGVPVNYDPNKKCVASTGNAKSPKNVYGLDNDNFFRAEISIDDVIAKLETLDLANIDTSHAGTIPDSYNDAPDGTPAEQEVTCSNSGAAESLGWIVCPVLNFLTNAANTIYEDYLEPALQVDPKLFGGTEGKNSGTYYAWGIFRGIANTVFIIVFLIVIFSQVTGIGIDNYGIKKILPKLIVIAIIVNLSYWICLICIDLSNIIGNGIQSLFDSIAVDLPSAVNVGGDKAVSLSEIGTTAWTAAALLGVLAVSIWPLVSSGEGIAGILLALLVAAISIAVAVCFLFILLAAREAAIIVLTVISPVAFVCYMLPNIKGYYDKWIKAWKALLILYPICGLLVGGGNFVSTLLLASGAAGNGFFTAFMAMVIGVVPIFFIPSLLKNSLAAIGNIGAKISGIGKSFGNKVSGNTDKTIRNSAAYKSATARSKERRNLRLAGYKMDKDGNYVERKSKFKTMGRIKHAIRGGDRGVAMAKANVISDMKKRGEEENLNGGGFVAAIAGLEAKKDDQMVSNAEAMLKNGKAMTNGGKIVNTNDARLLGVYHAEALKRYEDAKDETERKNAEAEVKAAQNLLLKTDEGRTAVQKNFEDAIESGDTAGLTMAASHVMAAAGDKFKSVNRGAHAMIADLSIGADITGIKNKIDDKTYDRKGTDKYTEESLAGADDAAISRLIGSMDGMSDEEIANLQGTAARALQKMQTGNLNVKPEVAKKLEEITKYDVSKSDAELIRTMSSIDKTKPGADRKIAAGLKTMQRRGLNKEIDTFLENNGDILATDSSGNFKYQEAVQTLRSSSNVAHQAYANSGAAGQSFSDFMHGTGTNSMQGHLQSLGTDAAAAKLASSGASWDTINRYQQGTGNEIVSNDTFTKAVGQMNNDTLLKVAGRNAKTGAYSAFNKTMPSADSKMSTVIKAMQDRNLDDHIDAFLDTNTDILKTDGSGNREYKEVVQTLKNSSNIAHQAYANVGSNNQSYSDFMRGTGANSMQGHLQSLGTDAASTELANNAAAMKTINRYQQGVTNEIMSTEMLADTLAKSDNNDVVNAGNQMLVTGDGSSAKPYKARKDLDKLTAEHGVKFKDSTIETLEKAINPSDPNDAVNDAMMRLAGDIKIKGLSNALDGKRREHFNERYRRPHGLTDL